ncbi:MAG: hypothetical protein GY711_15390 [bacterium]|nr:hypothetical protein [bacterium]
MIRINLLPEEYRRKARTPFKVMLAVAGAVTVNASLLAYWCWLTFGVAAEIETERSVLQLEMDGLTPQVNYHNALDGEIKVFASRELTLATITKKRVLWTKKMDELIDVVHSGNDGLDHYIWFDDLQVKQEEGGGGRRRGGDSFGSLKASGHSGSPKWNQVANFLEDIEDRDLTFFIEDFSKPGSPEGTLNPPDDDLIPAVNWSFPLTLDLRNPDDRLAARAEEVSK